MLKSKKDEFPPKNKPIFLLVLFNFFTLIIIFCLFFLTLRNLNKSVQKERMEYVNEIAHQIMTTQKFIENENVAIVKSIATIIETSKKKNFVEFQQIFSDYDNGELLLLDSDGRLVNLYGDNFFLTERKYLGELIKREDVNQFYTSLNNVEDYWFYSYPLNDVEIDNTIYISVLFAIKATVFKDNLSVTLFDYKGSSYIITKEGEIETKPEGVYNPFNGYNLYKSLIKKGAKLNDINKLQDDIQKNINQSRIIHIDKQEWLVTYKSIDFKNSIIVTIPLSETAKNTYTSLFIVILIAIFCVVDIGIFIIILYIMQLDRRNKRDKEIATIAAKSDFFSKMSHDIRTPLNGIIGMEMLALENVYNPEIVEEYLKKSHSSATYLLSILNDVLDMSRIESGKMEIAKFPFNMSSLLLDIENIITPTAIEKKLSFNIKGPRNFNYLYIGDSIRLKQIIINLLSNSVKFTKPGGTIIFSVDYVPKDDAFDMFTLKVKDNGIGISKTFMNTLFSAFEQETTEYNRQYVGSGLGLSIVKNLVDLMDGKISVESEVNKGTEFIITIPIQTGGLLEDINNKDKKELTNFEGLNVLLAEDNTLNQEITAAILKKKLKMNVEFANDGKEAVVKFINSKEGFYSLILMDVRMPVLNGLDATMQIRKLSRKDATIIPIIALSANAFSEDVSKSIKAGMNDHLSKPIDLDSFINTINKYIER